MTERTRAHLIVVLLALTASLNYLPSRAALDFLAPEGLVAARFGIAAIATLLLFPRQTRQMTRRGFLSGSLTGGLFGLALLPLYASLRHTHSGVTAFLIGSCALFVPLFEYIALKRFPNRYQVAGLFLGLVGTMLLTFKSGTVFDEHLLSGLAFDYGALWGVLSAIIFAWWSVAISYFRRTTDGVELGLGQIYGTAILFGFIALCSGGISFALPAPIWLGLLYLGVIGGAIRLVAQSHAQGFTTATSVEIIFLVEPIFAFVWAWLLAGEAATMLQVVGCAVIGLGVCLAQITPRDSLSSS